MSDSGAWPLRGRRHEEQISANVEDGSRFSQRRHRRGEWFERCGAAVTRQLSSTFIIVGAVGVLDLVVAKDGLGGAQDHVTGVAKIGGFGPWLQR